jgi:hypothetical protein
MPNFFKSLFKHPSTRSRQSTNPRPVPAELSSPVGPPPAQELDTQELELLAGVLQRELHHDKHDDQDPSRRRLFSLLGTDGHDKDEMMRRLVERLEGMQTRSQRMDGDADDITPYPSPSLQDGSEEVQRAARVLRKARKDKAVRLSSRDTKSSGSSSVAGARDWGKAVEACVGALGELHGVGPPLRSSCI